MSSKLLKALKIALGCCAAIFLARMIGLQNSASAGIITLLSIQDTRRETFRLAGKRLLGFLLALGLSFLVFSLLRWGVLAFGIFLLLFTFLSYSLSLQEGLSTCAVLVSHIWSAGAFTLPLCLNEVFLLLIGAGMGIVANSYMQDVIGLIRRDQSVIDHAVRDILLSLADQLRDRPARPHMDFDQLEALLEEAHGRAKYHLNNALRRDTAYYAEYVELRQDQCALLRNMREAVFAARFRPPQAADTAALLEHVAGSLHRLDNADLLLEEVEAARASFRASPLPASREEFEARALLYQTVRDLSYILKAKKRFVKSLTAEQLRSFWPDEPQECTE